VGLDHEVVEVAAAHADLGPRWPPGRSARQWRAAWRWPWGAAMIGPFVVAPSTLAAAACFCSRCFTAWRRPGLRSQAPSGVLRPGWEHQRVFAHEQRAATADPAAVDRRAGQWRWS
jgi:hypothetical protein